MSLFSRLENFGIFLSRVVIWRVELVYILVTKHRGHELTCQCQRHTRRRFDFWVEKIPWRRDGNPLRYSYLGNPMDRGAWPAAVHRVAESWTGLKQLSLLACRQLKFCFCPQLHVTIVAECVACLLEACLLQVICSRIHRPHRTPAACVLC